MRLLIAAFVLGLPVLAQSNDLSKQVALVKALIPNSSSMGILLNQRTQSNIDFDLGIAASENGIQVVKADVANIRDISTAMRSISQKGVNFIMLIEDRVITSKNSVKFVVKQTVGSQIPVFAQGEEALQAGAFGAFIRDGADWKLIINGKVKDMFNISIPEGDARISVQ